MRLLQSKSIRSRLFKTLTLAVGCVAAVIVGVWRFGIEPSLRMGVAKEQQQLAQRIADQIDEFLDHRIAELLMAADIGRFWENEKSRQKEALYRLLKLDPLVHEVSVVDREGQEVLRLSRTRVYSDADLVSLEGEEKFQQSIQGKVYMGKVYHAPTKEPFVTLAVPIKFTATDIRGVVVAEVSLKTLWDSISHIKVGRSGHAFVVDQEGRLIAHPDYSKVLLGISMAHLQEVREFLSHPDKDPDFGEVGVGQDGKEVISTFAVARRRPWGVFVEEPVVTALAEVKRVERIAGLIVLLLLTGAFGVSYWFSERIARPARQLEEGARLMAQGRLEHKLDIHTGDEIEALAREFNQMAEALKASYEGLEAKIAERTEETRRAYQEQQVLRELLSKLLVLDLDDLLRKMTEQAAQLFKAEYAWVRLFDEEGEIVTRAVAGDEEIVKIMSSLGEKGKLVGRGRWMLDNRKPLAIKDMAQDTDRPSRGVQAGLHGFLGAPLFSRDRKPLGVIHIMTRSPRDFSQHDLELIEQFANGAAIAIENARLLKETERRAQEQAALSAVAMATSRSLDLDELLQIALDKVLEVMGSVQGYIRLKDSTTGKITMAAHRGISEDFIETLVHRRTPGGKSDQVFETGEPLIINDPQGIILKDGTRSEGTNSIAWIPLEAKGKVVGVLNISTARPMPFTSQELALLQAIGNVIGVAVENAGLFEDTIRNLERVRVLREIDTAIASTLDLHNVLELLLERIDLVLPYSATTVRLFNKESGLLEPVACRNLDEQEWKADQWKGGRGIPNVVCESKAPWMVSNVQTDPSVRDPDFFKKHGLVSYLGVPLIVKDKVLGVLSFYTKQEHEFASEEVEFLMTLAGQAAIAVHNAQLYEQTKNQALELQRLNKVKDEFLSVMSHELRTPLTAVTGYMGMMQDRLLGDLNQQQERALDKMTRFSKDLLTMIESIMEATKIEAGAIVVEKQTVNLNDFLGELKSAYEIPQSKKLTLNWDIPPQLPVIESDSTKLKQILQNLIHNAIKFTDEGSVTISARIREDGRQQAEGNSGQALGTRQQAPEVLTHGSRLLPQASSTFIELKVADTGVGIAKEFLPVIFERFRQVDSSETRRHGGVGIGLYIVTRFTEVLGGKVEVESEPGKGSTFTVTIPSEAPQSGVSKETTEAKKLAANQIAEPRPAATD